MRAEISVLVKDTPEGPLAPSVTWGLCVTLPQTRNLPALGLSLLASRTVRNKCLWFISRQSVVVC